VGESLIAIVDDDASVCKATRRLVRSAGFSAEAFGSAEAFLGSNRLRDTICLILDVQMPGLSGLDLQDRLAAAGSDIPVIFISGFPDEGARARALEAGALCYLAKPFQGQQLLDYVGRALTRRPTISSR
jgi:FixJ family two-component response regulator